MSKATSILSLNFLFFFLQPVQSCPYCNNGGQTGMWTYMTCVPGAPGAPGRDGAKGDKGSPGKTGTKGPRGADGKKGAKGETGIQGSTGQKGQRGDKGGSGTPRLASHMNWKECTWKRVDTKNSGLIYVSVQRSFITRIKGTVSRYCACTKL